MDFKSVRRLKVTPIGDELGNLFTSDPAGGKRGTPGCGQRDDWGRVPSLRANQNATKRASRFQSVQEASAPMAVVGNLFTSDPAGGKRGTPGCGQRDDVQTEP
uniref:Uncharacterized protein n=1 Tax=Sphaerodactylus townsendi TaxID=933632 RepID=A0ACB8ECK4_9SAUR